MAQASPNPIDVHVGGRLRQLRNLRGLTQEKLAKAVGITFQQVQKYERGANRVGASRLYNLSTILRVPVNSFFEGMGNFAEASSSSKSFVVAEPNLSQDNMEDPFQKKETLQLVRAYYKIQDPALRKKVLELAKLLGKDDDDTA